jgi:formylglycine-generating enzyme required for sulfatase activity
VRVALVLATFAAALPVARAAAEPAPGAPSTVAVGPGVYRPMFPASDAEAEVSVAAFRLDRDPVTNAAFAAFVAAHPAWRRDRVKRVLADADYLAHWTSAETPEDAVAESPVVRISWFAARAFCAAAGGRLPTEREWELAAAASETARDASRDPAWAAKILAWYARPTEAILPAVGTGRANAWGVRDLHGLVWEWIEDYSAALVAGDGRGDGREMFCGAGGATAADATGYATFMRLAYRSSLRASFTTPNLGFRCAYDPEEEDK